jgi:TolB-like protein/tetratricopeptide (TPR) repeat protein
VEVSEGNRLAHRGRMIRSGRVHRFLIELQRRRVTRVAVGYAVAAWLIVEVADTVFPRLLLPDWAVTAVILAAVAGFPLAVVLAWFFDVVPAEGGGARGLNARAVLGLAAGLALILVVAGGVSRLGLRLVRPAAGIASLVVLPFQNLSGDEAEDYFLAGMHHALINELAQVGSLRVISRTSAVHYAAMGLSVPEIARELAVQAVVEASVRRTSEDIEIRVQLIQALPEEQPLWASVYTRSLHGALAMHGEIARAIAEQIRAELTTREERRLTRAPEVDPATFEAYLRGMHLIHAGGPANIQEGLRHLHAAVERSPANALAYTGLAHGYVTLGHSAAAGDDPWPRAREAATRAVTLDPELADAHAALAQVKYYYERDWDGAQREFLRAIELNPSLASNRYHYAWFLHTLGRMDEAIVEHVRAKELDPLTPVHTAWLAGLYLDAGRFDDAMRELRTINELVPNNFWGPMLLGETYMRMGMPDSAIAIQQHVVESSPRGRWLLARNLALIGRHEEARRIAAELEQQPNAWNALGLGAIYAALGENDTAWEWLAHEPPHAWLPIVADTMWFGGLRGDPRLPSFLEGLGLPPRTP